MLSPSDISLYSSPAKRIRLPKPVERKRRDGPLQAEIIPVLLDNIPGCRTHGWLRETLKAFIGLEEVSQLEDDFEHALRDLRLIPDAYVIHQDEAALHFFEVEVTHALTEDKLQRYAKFVTDMDSYGVAFELYTVSQHGHINRVDLLPHYVAWIKAGDPFK